MLKMIIVEDEKLEREGLVTYFDWNALGIEIVGTACDGIDGLELAEKKKPDIIITDIKMPGLDGIEMSKKIKSFLPEVKIVVLTGYDDFKYAKEAIQFKASAYILKHIEYEEMLSAIQNIVEECNNQRSINVKLTQEFINEKNKFLINLLHGKLQKERIKHEIIRYKLNSYVENEFLSIIIKFKENKEKSSEILNIDNLNIKNENVFCVINDEVEKSIYLCLHIENKCGYTLNVICEDALSSIYKIGNISFIAVGEVVKGIYELSKSFQYAKKTLEYSVFWGDTGISYYKDLASTDEKENIVGDFIVQGNNFSKQLIHAVASSEKDKVYGILEEMFKYIYENKGLKKDFIINYLFNIIYEAWLFVYNFNRNKQDVDKNDFGRHFWYMDSLHIMKDYTYEFFEVALNAIEEKRSNKDDDTVKRVIRIVEEKYMQDINLKVVAGEVFLSPNYLGNLFKKFTGKSFNEYLCEYRMKKAEELLINSDKKISSIAKGIGIPNTSYFCILFKNTYGLAPKEYKEMVLRN